MVERTAESKRIDWPIVLVRLSELGRPFRAKDVEEVIPADCLGLVRRTTAAYFLKSHEATVNPDMGLFIRVSRGRYKLSAQGGQVVERVKERVQEVDLFSRRMEEIGKLFSSILTGDKYVIGRVPRKPSLYQLEGDTVSASIGLDQSSTYEDNMWNA